MDLCIRECDYGYDYAHPSMGFSILEAFLGIFACLQRFQWACHGPDVLISGWSDVLADITAPFKATLRIIDLGVWFYPLRPFSTVRNLIPNSLLALTLVESSELNMVSQRESKERYAREFRCNMMRVVVEGRKSLPELQHLEVERRITFVRSIEGWRHDANTTQDEWSMYSYSKLSDEASYACQAVGFVFRCGPVVIGSNRFITGLSTNDLQ